MLVRRVAANGVVFYESHLLRGRGVPHAFSTRLGGISPPPFDSLNLGNPSGCDRQDDYERIYDNYRLLQGAIGAESRTRCWVHQVHGGEVALVERDRPFESGVKADALVGDDPAKILAVRVADCVPVLLSRDDGRRVAAVHAGWRGVIAGIVQNALRRLHSPSPGTLREGRGEGLAQAVIDQWTTSRKGENAVNVVAAIGPCIGFDHFEVGPEVLDQFERFFDGRAPIRRRDDGKGQVDLREAIRLQLLAAGVGDDRIDTTDRCTFRDADEYFSHRRDKGVTGRMAALISPAGP